MDLCGRWKRLGRGGPAIEPILTQLFQWMANHGCYQQVIIISQPVAKAQIQRVNQGEEESVPTTYVNTQEQANAVIRQLGHDDIAALLSQFIDTASAEERRYGGES